MQLPYLYWYTSMNHQFSWDFDSQSFAHILNTSSPRRARPLCFEGKSMGTELQPRHFRRYPVQLPLLHLPESSKSDGTRVGWTCDLSKGGARVELDRPSPAPTQLRVRLQTDHGVIEAMAQVVWTGEPLSPQDGIPHGLAFTQ